MNFILALTVDIGVDAGLVGCTEIPADLLHAVLLEEVMLDDDLLSGLKAIDISHDLSQQRLPVAGAAFWANALELRSCV